MKKIYTYLTLLAGASVLILSSCTREVVPTEPEKENTPAKVRTEVVGVKTESDETKVTLTGSTFAWQDGDAIAVWTGTTNTSGSFQDCTVSEGKITVTLAEGESRKNYAVYPASVKDETYAGGTLYVKLPASYAHTDLLGTKTPLPMVANNTESSLTFYNVAGLLRITVKAIPNTATGLVFQFPGNKVNGTFAVDNPGTGTSSIATGTPGIGEDKITVTFPANTATEMTLNIPLPTGNYDDVFITPVSSTKVAAVRHIKAGGYEARRARGRQLTATLVSFSVSAEKKVIFSPGNLVYDNGNWRFHANQYDRCFTANGDVGSHYASTGTFDLFGWGTSGWSVSGVESWTNYQPWATSNTNLWITGGSGTPEDPYVYNNTFENNQYGYGPEFNSANPNLSGINANGDWGVYNKIGDYPAGTWRTFTTYKPGGESLYLFETRTCQTTGFTKVSNANNAKYAKATVAGVKGIIIFPDVYDQPAGAIQHVSGSSWLNTASKSYDDFVVDDSGWAKMEAAGAVFLPAAGYRRSVSVYQAGEVGKYWASTNHTDGLRARLIGFQDNGFSYGQPAEESYFGMSVRLVRDL